MARQKLNFRFHDPNPAGVAAEYIAKVFMEVNRKRVDKLIVEELSKNEQMEMEDSTENMGCYSA